MATGREMLVFRRSVDAYAGGLLESKPDRLFLEWRPDITLRKIRLPAMLVRTYGSCIILWQITAPRLGENTS
jgi:hypothetical protein